ncbi:MAG: universal stress protein [Nitrospirae bacterium]|nr:universal stress protein [Nitrospirota bacterium]
MNIDREIKIERILFPTQFRELSFNTLESLHLSAGNDVREILSISREFGAGMIIMGTTGKDRLHELFLGSVSHRVAETSELPTLLVP